MVFSVSCFIRSFRVIQYVVGLDCRIQDQRTWV
jgi:hypothetical protein